MPTVFYNIGANDQDQYNAGIGWGLPTRGYDGFIREEIVPDLMNGYLDYWLHNPFGAWNRLIYDGKKDMQFDQWLEIQENTDGLGNFERITSTFVNSWQFIQNYVRNMNVTAYLGKLPDDPDFDARLQAGDLDKWFERLKQALSPILQSNMNIGLDAIATPSVDSTHYAYGFAIMLRDLLARTGKKLYVEPVPVVNGTEHWASFNSMSTSHHINTYDSISPVVDNFMSHTKGEHMIMLNHQHSNDYFVEMRKYIARGFSPLVPAYRLKDKTLGQTKQLLYPEPHLPFSVTKINNFPL